MEENDVREIFAPFGEIVNMDMSKDEISRTNKGYAFIEYKTVKVRPLVRSPTYTTFFKNFILPFKGSYQR